MPKEIKKIDKEWGERVQELVREEINRREYAHMLSRNLNGFQLCQTPEYEGEVGTLAGYRLIIKEI